ncbi:MAG: hypothetical protein WA864_00545 [Acetobacteraceae bacterium]
MDDAPLTAAEALHARLLDSMWQAYQGAEDATTREALLHVRSLLALATEQVDALLPAMPA